MVLGHCMGGTLAVALAQGRAGDLDGLAVLAAPWDFHAAPNGVLPLLGTLLLPLTLAVAAQGCAPRELVQAFFSLPDLSRAVDKFARFAELDPACAEARLFVAVEDWLGGGEPVPGPAALECLWDSYVANQPARGDWRPLGEPVRPERLRLPALVAVPSRDRVVPRACADPLALALPGAQIVRPAGGHVGMLVKDGPRAVLVDAPVRWLDGLNGFRRSDRQRRRAPAGCSRGR